jgi:hypothetical protein
MSTSALPTLLLGLAACGSAATYRYHADTPTTAVETGKVHVSSNGLTNVRGSGNVVPAITVRMVVENDGAVPWTVDYRDGRLTVPGEGSSAPMWKGGTVSIAPGERRVIDFFFTPPGIVNSNSGLPRYTFSWIVRTPDGNFGSDARFARGPTPS